MLQPINILSIETATQVCAVAIHQNRTLLGHLELNLENAHSAKLLRLVERLFFQLEISARDIHAVAVSAGPGSYTGLRIGVSTAKGICFANGIPLIGIDTLAALAHPVTKFAEEGSFILPMLDARRKEVYTAVFRSDGKVLKDAHALIVEANPFLGLLEKGKVYFLGDGLGKLRAVLDHPNAVFLDMTASAEAVGFLAYGRYSDKKFEDLAYFEPNYLKEFRVNASSKNPLEV